MPKPNHTPGPWSYEKSECSPYFYVSAGSCDTICEIEDDLEADAMLIAAAPDMLEALLAMQSAQSCLVDPLDRKSIENNTRLRGEAIRLQKLAISKATGG